MGQSIQFMVPVNKNLVGLYYNQVSGDKVLSPVTLSSVL